MQEIRTLNMTSRIGGVNGYLVKTEDGNFVLVDTGMPMHRTALLRELQGAGCPPGQLKLIVITHGDTDHAGNAAFLRDRYGARIAMHPRESEVVERGNMLLSRKRRTIVARILFSLVGLGKADRFKPDVLVEDGDDLSECGFSARVLHLPGHSIGSIGVLTTGGRPGTAAEERVLFCGDLLTNTKVPAKNTLVDDPAEMDASVARLEGLGIKTVYPGHGKPFAMQELDERTRPGG